MEERLLLPAAERGKWELDQSTFQHRSMAEPMASTSHDLLVERVLRDLTLDSSDAVASAFGDDDTHTE